MIRHKFREEKSSLDKVLRPVAGVILEKDGFYIRYIENKIKGGHEI